MRSAAWLLALAACGGSAPPPSFPPGDSHVVSEPPKERHEPTAPEVASPPPAVSATVAEPEPALGTTILLKNSGDSEILFSVTKGWQPVIFAYSGKPPKAKSILLFPTHCTASCDAGEGLVCPVCAEPKTKKEEAQLAKYETVAPGGSVRVPWDGKIFVYEKASGKRKCKCWQKADPAADSYTIKACGLKPSGEAGKPSQSICAEATVNLGPGDANPKVVTLTFGP